jgi:alpha-L-fucosidase 2
MRVKILLLTVIYFIIPECCAVKENKELKLWYKEPALRWEEALPIGNGRLGAMIYGGPAEDHIQFNEETLWTGAPHDYSHKGAYEYLGKIRELLWQGKQKEAEDLALENFMSVPLRQEKYQPFGDLWITFKDHDDVSEYRRELNLSDAECKTMYRAGGNIFTREYIASQPDNLIIIHLTSSGKRSLTFDVSFTAEHEDYSVITDNEGCLRLKVKIKEGVLHGTAILRATAKDGEISVNGNKIHVEKTSEATLWLSAATNFVNPSDVSGDPDAKSKDYLDSASDQTYREARKKHLAEYQDYFNRFSIDLGVSGNEELPTDKRILKITESMDNSLAALYVQYGRYLILSSSRAETYPANLQGIWNDRLNPSWDSKYTVNINTEMNYWPVEILNIAECHKALFRMIEEVVPAGEMVAVNHYGARGWVLHHNTDLWRGAAPINASNHGIWVTGSGWMAHHFWEHYLFGRDSDFLRNVAWPVMKGAATFYVDFLVHDPQSGWLVSVPSNSPENGGLVSGPTMDHEIIRSLFKACIEASEILKINEEFADTLRQMLSEIAPYKIGRFGQLQEWMEDIDDPDNKHRHVSHLWGVYPGNEINWEDNPELMEAAKRSLIARGDEGTGWSLAWKISFWARFRDGNHAWKMVQMLLRPEGGSKAIATGGGSSGGGSYPNLFDAHPPFQIDGNFGGASGIAEMLLQSHLDAIDILPALPEALPEGHVKGIRARGGFELEFEWREGVLTDLIVHSVAGSNLSLRYGDNEFHSETEKGKKYVFDRNLKLISN